MTPSHWVISVEEELAICRYLDAEGPPTAAEIATFGDHLRDLAAAAPPGHGVRLGGDDLRMLGRLCWHVDKLRPPMRTWLLAFVSHVHLPRVRFESESSKP